jgi:hypothetical protein
MLLQLPRPGGGIHQPGSGLRQLRLVGTEPGLGDVEIVLVRRRVDAEQELALLHQPVGLDGHLDHPSAHLRDHLHDVLDHPDVGRRRRDHVERQDQRGQCDDRDDDDGDLRRGVPRQPLELDEDQPDEERVDTEQ